MYRIYCDDTLIYNDIAPEEEVRLIAPTVEWSDNSTGSLTFTMPQVNVGYEDLTLMKSKIKLYRNDDLIWVGRPIKETKDFWKNRQITCEGAMGYLNDVIQPQRELPGDQYEDQFHGYPEEFLQIILDYHNEVMHQNGLDDRRIFLGTVTVTDMMKSEDPDEEYYSATGESVETFVPTIYTDHKNTFELISEKLISGKNVKGDDLEGHLRFHIVNGTYYLDYLKDPIDQADQEIEFGKNLLDFTINYDESEFCTVLHPLGASDGESVGNMSAHIELLPEQNGEHTKDEMIFNVTAPRVFYPAGVTEFGYIEKTVEFSDITDEDVLLDKTMEWFTKNRFNDMEIDIKAFDLAYMGVQYEFLHYMDSVHVRSLPHGLDKNFPVLGVSIPLDQPQNASYTLGKKKVQSLSTHQSEVSKEMKENRDYALAQTTNAYHKSETLIRNATSGVVNVMQNNFGAEAMVIVDLDKDVPADQAILQKIHDGTITVEDLGDRHMWVWNLGGLAYFEHGLSHDSKVAIDMEGKINADFIKAGTIKGINIEGAAFSTPRISNNYYIDIDRNTLNYFYVDPNTGYDRLIGQIDASAPTSSSGGIGDLYIATFGTDVDMSMSTGNQMRLAAPNGLYLFSTNSTAYLSKYGRGFQEIATVDYVDNAIGSVTGDYVTTTEMNNAISDALSPYPTSTQVANAISSALSGYATKDWVREHFVKK